MPVQHRMPESPVQRDQLAVEHSLCTPAFFMRSLAVVVVLAGWLDQQRDGLLVGSLSLWRSIRMPWAWPMSWWVATDRVRPVTPGG
jgi:hypothetical protein